MRVIVPQKNKIEHLNYAKLFFPIFGRLYVLFSVMLMDSITVQ